MTMLVNRLSIVSADAFDITAVMNHVRVSMPEEASAVATMARSAVAEFEQAAQVALLHQTITVSLLRPDLSSGSLRLPVGPVFDDGAPTMLIDGEPINSLSIINGIRPVACWSEPICLLTPDRVEIEYQAGFGSTDSDVPDDVSQAVMDQAAVYYDGRGPQDRRDLTTSPHMQRIVAKYRGVSL